MAPTVPAESSPRRPQGAVPVASLLQHDSSISVAQRNVETPGSYQRSPPLRGTALQASLSGPVRRNTPVVTGRLSFDPVRASGMSTGTSASPRNTLQYYTSSLPSAVSSSSTRTPGGSGPSILSSSHDTPSDPNRFKLEIVQQPEAARACGPGERDRRVIDPPPILQLYIRDFDSKHPQDQSLLKDTYNMVHCSLFKVSNRNDPLDAAEEVTVTPHPQNPAQDSRLLMGTLAMSPFISADVTSEESKKRNGGIGVYYIFHDVSCRQNGLYRLKFKLVTLDPIELDSTGRRAPISAEAVSNVFEVFSAKDFPGMRESSKLAKALKDLGATIPIKKGAENKK